jgi:hypothetical protein
MPRGYRCILVAFVGWLAAYPEQAAAKPPGDSNGEIASALNNLASALQKPEYPSKHDEPCDPPSNKRTSDLCAQWKAADAAKSAAQAAWWVGIAGSIIGAITLAIAWAAARWARKAAIHTEESAIESKRAADAAERGLEHAKDVSHTELRPWIQISVEPHSAYNDVETVKVFCLATLKNLGRIPAQDVWVGTTAADIPTSYYKKYGPQEDYTLAREEMSKWQPILPGGEVSRLVSFELRWDETEPPFKAEWSRHMCPYFGVHVDYALGGGKRGETVQTFQFGVVDEREAGELKGFTADAERTLRDLRVKEGVRGKIT